MPMFKIKILAEVTIDAKDEDKAWDIFEEAKIGDVEFPEQDGTFSIEIVDTLDIQEA